MTLFRSTVRSGLLLAALLHALVGGWGAWLHGAPLLDRAAVHADAGAGESAAQLHGGDCALCHTASQNKLATPRAVLWPAARDAAAGVAHGPLSAPSAAPVRTGGARAPPRPV